MPSTSQAAPRSSRSRSMIRSGLGAAILSVSLFAPVLAAADSPTGADATAELFSATALGGGAFVSSGGSAQAAATNPASAATLQQLTIDATYSLLAGLGDEAGVGHALATGLVYPTKYGVFGGTLNFLSSPFDSAFPLGTRAGFTAFASKTLYPRLSLGLGAEGSIGPDYSLGLSLGASGAIGDVGFMKDLRWGAAFTGLGVGSVPSPFTFTGGAAFGLIREDRFALDLAADLSLPSFSNLAGKIGVEARIGELAKLGLSTGFNLKEAIDGQAASAIPGISLTADFALAPAQGAAASAEASGTDAAGPSGASVGGRRGDVKVSVGARPLYDGVWAFGTGAVVTLGVVDKEPPVISIDYPETFWMSPNNDGKADYLEFPVTIRDRRYVASWRFLVTDASGATVRELRNKERRPETSGFKGVMNRVLDVASGVEVPATLRWDGTTDSGSLAPDGNYFFRVEATDDNGNTAVSASYQVMVDATPPTVDAGTAEGGDARIFSPDGDGSKDTLSVLQDGSVEERWDAAVYDAAGNAVRHWTFENAAPSRLDWDGKDDAGHIVADGVYRYGIAATDRALNQGSATVENIIVNTEKPLVSLVIDEGWISPNGDGVKDTLRFSPGIPVKEGLVSWTLQVLDSSGTVRRSWTGGRADLGERTFDGSDGAGTALPDGSYRGALTARYQNGYEAKMRSPSFVIDTVAPSVQVLVPGAEAQRTFSPDGDGSKDTFRIAQGGSREVLWTASFVDAGGKTVRALEWADAEPPEFDWNGEDDAGRVVPDGLYDYTIKATDKAGNAAAARLAGIRVDLSRPDLALAVSDRAFSPNGDGAKDDISLQPAPASGAPVESWKLDIVDAAGTVRRHYEGVGTPPEKLSFDGRDGAATKQILPEGSYRGRLTVAYRNGWTPQALSPVFLLDLTPPAATVAVLTKAFSPNGDGNIDQAIFSQEASTEDRWIGEVTKDGVAVRTLSFDGQPPERAAWDGLDDKGTLAADGTYQYRLVSVDAAGNRGSSQAVSFGLSTADTPVLLTADMKAFSPNGDGTKDAVTLTAQVKVVEGIESWRLDILSAAGNLVRSVAGTGGAPGPFAWNGKTDRGAAAPDGSYSARLEIRYAIGNRPVANSAPFAVDTAAPKIALGVDRKAFSPNGDGSADTLTIRRGSSGDDAWTAQARNASGTAVRSWTWKGEAPDLVWDGTDDAGNVVPDGTYSFVAESRDDAGNYASAEIRPLAVDTAPPQGDFKIPESAFSPNKDGVKDILAIAASTPGTDSWKAAIVDASGTELRRWTWTGAAPKLAWDGTSGAGSASPEGSYSFVASASDDAGNKTDVAIRGIVLDTTPPAVDISFPYLVFSPNGDGRKDTLPVRIATDGDESWKAAVLDASGAELAGWTWKGAAPSLGWDGKDKAGNVVADGNYRFYASSEDAAGNRTSRSTAGIVVDDRPTRVFLTVSAGGVSPNGDGAFDELRFGSVVNLKEGIDSWKLEILDENGALRRSLGAADVPGSTAGQPPSSLSWNGLDDDGAVREGKRTARLSVQYLKGDLAVATAGPFVVDVTPPQLSVETNPRYFSPDNDGVEDELSVALSAKDPSGIESWAFEVREPQPPAQVFFRIDGTGEPRNRFVWDGRSNKGELVQAATDYPYGLSASDPWGNTAALDGTLGVDVLVIREGNALKIKVPSIIFRENEADFVGLAADTVDNNTRVLKRIAQILNKFRDYKVVIEGHANNVTGTEQEELKELLPLSKKRADAVKAILVSFGVDAQRLSTVGVGGRKPVVSRNDRDNWWKNRRVEFILVK